MTLELQGALHNFKFNVANDQTNAFRVLQDDLNLNDETYLSKELVGTITEIYFTVIQAGDLDPLGQKIIEKCVNTLLELTNNDEKGDAE